MSRKRQKKQSKRLSENKQVSGGLRIVGTILRDPEQAKQKGVPKEKNSAK